MLTHLSTLQVLTEKFQEKIAKLELVGDQDSWGSALLKIKSMADGEITAIYSDVFGIDCKFLCTPCEMCRLCPIVSHFSAT